MAQDIPLQSESEFTSDMVKAVENIAQNVKAGSSEFSTSIDALSKSIDSLRDSLLGAINSLKTTTLNISRPRASASAAEKKPKEPSIQNIESARKKEEERKVKEETKALRIKTAQERAIFNAKQLQLKIEEANESKVSRKKNKNADIQNQNEISVFDNIGKGFGDVFAVTREQVAAIAKSGKKGKKEKPFVMDMAALATASVKVPEGPGTDLPKQFVGDIMNASAAWNNVFANASESAKAWSDVFSIADESKPKATKEFDPGTDFADPIIRILEQTSEEIAAIAPTIEYTGGPSYSVQEEPVEPYYSPYIGTPKEEPMIPRDQLVGPTQEDEATYNRKKQLEQEAVYIKESVDNFGIVFEAMFGKMGKSLQDNISAAMSSINKSFSGKSPVFDFVKKIGFSILGFKSKGNTGTQFLNSGGEVDSIFKPKGTDTVPAMLTPGEAVIKKSAAEKPENKSVIDAMNMSSGGKVGYFAGGTPTGGGGGIVGGIASLALGPVGTAFSVLTGSVKAASQALSMFGGFVAKANPAIIEQLNLAMNDLQGVIGRALVPEAQKLLQPLRYLGDGMDFVFKTLTPAISPLVNAFKTLITPLIQVEATVAGLLAPAFQAISTAIEGFSIILDPIVQLIAEVIESFTQFNSTITFGTDAAKIMGDGFKILGEIIKGFVGLIVTVMGLFMSGMGVILQGVGYLVQGFASLIKGIGGLISKIPMMGTVGAILTEAGIAVESGSESIKSGGADLQKRGEDQRDRGLAKAGEAASNVYNKFADMNYKMKDETRFKPGDVTGKGIVKGSSVGAAVREAQSTSIAGVGDEIRKQALMAATGTKTQEESLKDISDKLNKDNLRDAFRDGMIAANGANKGNSEIKGKDPFAGMSHSKPTLAPV